ncbi:hypothetical protein [Desulfovibrio falkowii]|uniref:hypothetical protein n=1 Tax=Desulfovibrio sp. WGS1351 TaxID=3366814 RepID=UPI00372D38A6
MLNNIKKKYITGEEIFSAGICTPEQLGYLCFIDEITAYYQSGGAHYMGGSQFEEFKDCGVHSRTSIPFPFGMDEYEKMCIENNPTCGYFEILDAYADDLRNMVFSVHELTHALNKLERTELEQGNRIKRSLWENKSPQQVCNDMRASGYKDDSPIAYVLYQCLGIKNLTEIGTHLRGDNITSSARQKYAKKKLNEARGRYETE